jgi:peptidoglycan hydrolase-like protein with peptidoglycan-binding domain
MSLASQKVGTGIVFALLISAMFAESSGAFEASKLHEAALAARDQSAVKKMQQALVDRGHYRGKVDGVIGLRTRASIRSLQKAQNLPATGRLDSQTASKLGVKPESIGRKDEPGNQAAKDKPWAGTRLATGTRRTHRTFPEIVPTGVDHEDSSKNGREDELRAENQKRPH